MTVLIIDDDQDDIDIFCEAMNEVDERVTCIGASTGQEGINLLLNGTKPEFVFLDLNMPLMNGKQCLRTIKSNHFIKDIPIFVYTTSGSSEDVAETSRLGATHFFTKPSRFLELKSLIASILQGDWKKHKAACLP